MKGNKKLEGKICIFGVGQRGIGLYYFLKKNNIDVFCFCDNDKKKRGYVLDDVYCYLLDELQSDLTITYVIANRDFSEEIRVQLEQAGITNILFDVDIYKELCPGTETNVYSLDSIIEYYNGVLYDAFRRGKQK